MTSLPWNNIDCSWLFKNIIPDNVYFYRIFFGQDTLFLASIAKQLKLENKTLFLVHFEGTASVIDELYKNFIVPFNFNEENIILNSTAIDAHEKANFFALKYKRKPIRTNFYNLWAHMYGDHFFTNSSRLPELEIAHNLRNNHFPTKTFICLNRRWTLHRAVLVALLYKNNLIDSNYVSFSSVHPSQALIKNKVYYNKNLHTIMKGHSITSVDDHNNLKQIWSKSLPYLQFYHRNNKDVLNALNEDIINIPELKVNESSIFTKTFDTHYGCSNNLDNCQIDSLISLVTETCYYSKYHNESDPSHRYQLHTENSTSFTEKIWRPIMFKQPFIIVSTPNFLYWLKTLGYKTFHPYIDESYDMELDDSVRFIKIINELKRLEGLTYTEKQSLIQYINDITEHNFQVFKTQFQTFLGTL